MLHSPAVLMLLNNFEKGRLLDQLTRVVYFQDVFISNALLLSRQSPIWSRRREMPQNEKTKPQRLFGIWAALSLPLLSCLTDCAKAHVQPIYEVDYNNNNNLERSDLASNGGDSLDNRVDQDKVYLGNIRTFNR